MFVKRLFDLFIAILALAILLVPLLLCAFMVRLKLGRPIFFTQERPGLNGELFRLIKFRTMNDERDGSGDLLPDRDRMTSLGKWMRSSSADELPELINILKGEMSFVGPRPLLPEYLDRYDKIQAIRHDVRPGLTGWAQVNGRNAISWEKRLEMDVWYVENRSFWLDLKIFWMTFAIVLNRRGVNASGHVSMPPFQGSGKRNDVPSDKE